MFCLPPRSPLFPYTTLFRSPSISISIRVVARCRTEAGTTALICDSPTYSSGADSPSNSSRVCGGNGPPFTVSNCFAPTKLRSEEHTSELQSPDHLLYRLLLE